MEEEFQIFGSLGKDEMRKWTYPYLEVLAEQVWKTNEIFRSPGRAEVRKAELQIFGNQGRAEVRKRNFTSLEVPAEVKCGNGLPAELRKQNITSLAVKAKQKCGRGISDLWKSWQR